MSFKPAPLPLLLLALVPLPAAAAFHLFDIVEVYSNADGSVQFIELFTTNNSQDEMEGHTIDTDTSAPYVFPMDLGAENPGDPGDNATANKSFLVATPDFACPAGQTQVVPDYTLPAALFFALSSDSIDFGPGQDSFAFTSGELPTDGSNSLNEPFGSNVRTTATNSPTNFAGDTCTLPEPGALASLAAGAGLLFCLRRRR